MSLTNLISPAKLFQLTALSTALALSGCGGGGGGSPADTTDYFPPSDGNGSTDDGDTTGGDEAVGNYKVFLAPSSPKITIKKGQEISVVASVIDKNTNGNVSGVPVTFKIDDPTVTGVFTTTGATVTTDASGTATLTLQIKNKLSAEQEEYLKNTGLKVTAQTSSGSTELVILGSDEEVIDNTNAEYEVFISKSANTMKTGSDKIDVTVRVTNTDAGTVANVPVNFAITDPKNGLSFNGSSKTVTDENGVVVIGVVQNNTNINAQLDHRATLEVVVDDNLSNKVTTPIQVDGSRVSGVLTSSKALLAGETLDVSGYLNDGSGSGIWTGFDDTEGDVSKVILLNNGNEIASTNTSADGGFKFEKIEQGNLTANSEGNYIFDLRVIGLLDVTDDTIKSQTFNEIAQVVQVINQDLSIDAPDSIIAGESATVTVKANGLDGETIILSTTSGTFASGKTEEEAIIRNGKATFDIKSIVPGVTTLTAQVDGDDSNKVSSNIYFLSTDPAKLTVQAKKTELAPNSSTEITASVRDENDSPVANAWVSVSIVRDSSGGRLSEGRIKTDINGNATVSYTSGNNPTSSNGVELLSKVTSVEINGDRVTTEVDDVDTQTTYLTVQTTASTIAFGLSDKLSTDSNEVYYYRAGSAAVNNNAGQSAANQTITLALRPRVYYKGQFYFGSAYLDNVDSIASAKRWYPQTFKVKNLGVFDKADPNNNEKLNGIYVYSEVVDTVETVDSNGNVVIKDITALTSINRTRCNNEDKNFNSFLDTLDEDTNGNGELDAGEDTNGNGKLDVPEDYNNSKKLEPGFRPTILVNGTEVPNSNGVYNLRTDENGRVDFQIRYFKQDAQWLEMDLVATTRVDGSETTANQIVYFPVLEKDVDNDSRPNMISPFGVANTCKSAL